MTKSERVRSYTIVAWMQYNCHHYLPQTIGYRLEILRIIHPFSRLLQMIIYYNKLRLLLKQLPSCFLVWYYRYKLISTSWYWLCNLPSRSNWFKSVPLKNVTLLSSHINIATRYIYDCTQIMLFKMNLDCFSVTV